MGDDGAGVFAGGEHGGLNMNVTVQHARGDIGAGGVDHAGVLADAVLRVADEGDAAAVDGHVDMLADLVCADVDEPGVEDDRLGGHVAHRDGGESGGAFPKRHFADLFAHSVCPFRHISAQKIEKRRRRSPALRKIRTDGGTDARLRQSAANVKQRRSPLKNQ